MTRVGDAFSEPSANDRPSHLPWRRYRNDATCRSTIDANVPRQPVKK